eukprot:909560-Pyramimonas_sp.AAC.1
MTAVRLRPALQLIRRFTFPAPQLRLTVQAHQAGLLMPLRVVQHVFVEREAAQVLEAIFALVLV